MIVSRNLHIVCILYLQYFLSSAPPCNVLSVLSVLGMDGCGPPEVEVVLVCTFCTDHFLGVGLT